jgi:LysM repeat protein
MKKLLVVIALFAVIKLQAQEGADILEYITTYKDLAIQEMIRTGVPASITLAQGIHETSAGKSALVLKSNNHFGIKCKSSWTGGKVYHDDDAAGECFRQYALPNESYRDHSDFLKTGPRYASLFNLDPHDYKAWAFGLKKAGYATNNKYPQILIKLIETYNLQDYTLIAMGEKQAPSGEVIVSANPAEPTVIERPLQVKQEKALNYPAGEFKINQTRVIYLPSGTSLLAVAEEFDIPYSRLLDFNDMKDVSVLESSQLIFLQRKRKQGSKEFHVVEEGESLYLISQAEGIRLEALAELNLLTPDVVVATGEKLNLKSKADARPILQSEVVNVGQEASEQDATNSIAMNATSAKHIVKTKETLYSISKMYGIELEKLQEWNRLDTTDLRIGQELVIIKN